MQVLVRESGRSGTLVVERPEVVRLFADVRNVELLTFFAPPGSTVGALARAFDLTLNAAFRKVKRFEALGLLRVSEERPRSGRAVKRYTCAATSFFVPTRQRSLVETLGESFGAYQSVMNAAFVRHSEEGPNPVGGMLLMARGGELWMLPATPEGEPWTPGVPGTPALHHASGALMLDYEEARELQAELIRLFDRYRARRGSHAYLMHLFMTPLGTTRRLTLPNAGYSEWPMRS